jgi:hypothetical protein
LQSFDPKFMWTNNAHVMCGSIKIMRWSISACDACDSLVYFVDTRTLSVLAVWAVWGNATLFLFVADWAILQGNDSFKGRFRSC